MDNQESLISNGHPKEHRDQMEQKSFHPTQRRCFGIVSFIVNLGMLNILLMTMTVYNMAVVRTLEKRFGLTSTQTGMLWSMNDIVHICLVLLAGFFGRRGHKPKIISFTMAFAAVGTFLMMSPYFLFPLDTKPAIIANVTAPRVKEAVMCVSNSSQGDEQCIDENGITIGHSVHPAFYIFGFAQLFCGVGGCALGALGLAYVDENAPKHRVPFYIGIVTSFFAIGPVCGHLLSALTLSLPEDLTSETNLTPKHPMWIGCWWLGYLIVAIGMVAAVVPMWFFPKHIRPPLKLEEKSVAKTKKPTMKAFWENVKTFPRMTWALLHNWALIIMIMCSITFAYIIHAMLAPMVRYMEVHFMLPAYKAALVTGVSSAGGGVLGGVLGGGIMSVLKLRAKGSVGFMIVCGVLGTGCILTALFMKCPQPEMVGSIGDDGRFTVGDPCNEACSCPKGHGSYSPMCGSDGKNYYSPCFAGCTGKVNSTFNECSCIASNVTIADAKDPQASYSSPSHGWAYPGLCPVQCPTLVPYCIAILCMCLCGAISRVPGSVVMLRIVKPEEKTFAMGINSFAMNLFGMVPGPILIGALIDRTCKLWQRNCNGSGVCLLFDTTLLRQSTYGLAVGCHIFVLLLAFPLYHFVGKVQEEQEVLEKEVHREVAEKLLEKTKNLDLLEESKV